MCEIELILKDGSVLSPGGVLSLRLERELEVPADILSLNCAFDERIRKNADFIKVQSGGEIVFQGRLDSVSTLRSKGGTVMKLSSRSLAAGLLDCEAEPLVYTNPSAQFIFNRHLKPFGISGFDADRLPLYGVFRIDKGMSHWQALQSFCRHKYSAEPYISPGGKAYFRGYDSDFGIIFGEGGSEYYSIREDRLRCRLITDVRLRLGAADSYKSALSNPNPECAGIKRTRYVDAAADNSSVEIADKIIDKSNSRSYTVVLECPGCLAGALGKRAIVKDSELGVIESMRVCAVKYTVSGGAETTKVTLRKESF